MMKYYYFNYISAFKCKAGECKHNCCKGWVIPIDTKSLNKYSKLSAIDQDFVNNVDYNNKRFNQENANCKFLDQSNLCKIINKYGESYLCNTCKTHPRFKNFYKSFIEVGGGASCEEMARLIVSGKKKMKLNGVKNLIKENANITEFEKQIIKYRNKVIKVIQNRKLKISQRVKQLLSICQVRVTDISVCDWFNFLLELEKLDCARDEVYNKVINFNISWDSIRLDEQKYARSYEQVLSYFAYRHIPRAIDKLDLRLQTALAVLSFLLCVALFESGLSLETYSLEEAIRFYSAEIEYSNLNLNAILDKLEGLVKLI